MNTARIVTHTQDPEYWIGYCARVSSPKNQERMAKGELTEAGLLKYCAEHGHWSVFEMANVVMEIKTTRAISAQIIRHRSFAFQEFSARYATVASPASAPEMRAAGAKNRQSSMEPIETHSVLGLVEDAVIGAFEKYKTLIEDHGVAQETARMILPMCSPTVLYMNGTVRSWIHYLQVRCNPDVQKEHREVALSVRRELSRLLPTCSQIFGWA